MTTESLKQQMLENAAEISRLHGLIHETLPSRGPDWENACAEFHARYDMLAFPGGYDDALERIAVGDEQTIEAAICFLEVRPFFFRSGYMFDKLLKRCKRAPLTASQNERLDAVFAKLLEWRKIRAINSVRV